jgi:hypothetical protein
MLVAGRWYDPVSARSLYEAQYEAVILANANELFSGFRCVPFKVPVDSEYGMGKPDLALIDLQYRAWLVVEVELDTHPLREHVEEQVRKFSFGHYNDRHARWIHSQARDLDLSRLQHMLLGEQPQVLVLVTSSKPTWASALARFGAKVGIIEMFRDDLDEVMLRVNGDQPTLLAEETLSLCVPERLFNALRLASPAPFVGHDKIELLIDGKITEWKIMRVSDTAWIIPTGRWPIDTKQSDRLRIVQGPGGSLELRDMEES